MCIHIPETSQSHVVDSQFLDPAGNLCSIPINPQSLRSSAKGSIRILICSTCGKMFRNPSHLRDHVRTHSQSKPFQCPFPNCKKAFAQNSNLKKHLNTHSKWPDEDQEILEPEFEMKEPRKVVVTIKATLRCQFCNEEFSNRKDYKIHLSSDHHDEKVSY